MSKPRSKNKLFLIGAGVLALGFPPSALLVLGGLAPTYVALLTDRTKGRLTALTVGALNIAALSPLLLRLWDRGHEFDYAVKLLLSPFSWILLLGGAGIGWFLAQVCPVFFAALITGRDKGRLQDIKARQQKLTEEWGTAIPKQQMAAARPALIWSRCWGLSPPEMLPCGNGLNPNL